MRHSRASSKQVPDSQRAFGGRAGGEHTIDLLRDELGRLMSQLRCSRLTELARHLPTSEPGHVDDDLGVPQSLVHPADRVAQRREAV
jgi:hypothetical protein